MKEDIGHITTRSPEKVNPILTSLAYVNNLKIDGSRIEFTLTAGKRKELLDALASHELESIEVHRPTLSDVFFHHTGKSMNVPMERPSKGRGMGKRRRMG